MTKARWVIPFLFLAACGTTTKPEAPINTVTVDRSVPVSCVPPDAPTTAPPTLTAAQLLAEPDAAARYQKLAAFWNDASPELALLAGLVTTCRNAAPAPKP